MSGSEARTSDFFDDHSGNARNLMDHPRRSMVLDRLCDVVLRLDPRAKRIARAMADMPRQRVLVVGVEVPNRGGALHEITRQLANSRHHVEVSTVLMQPRGKFENLDEAIAAAPQPLGDYDWMIITDDDVALPEKFTDRYLAAASLANLVVSQPAHCYQSFATYQVTRRRPRSMIRQTNFVEIGPLTVINRVAFGELVPFPPSRWAYGIDVVWAELCRRHGWNMGVVDALPIRHLRPVAGSYDMTAAIDEGRALLTRFDVRMNRAELFAPGRELLA